MLNSKAFAQAVAVVMGMVFIVCRLLTALAPQFVFTIGQSWIHTINFTSVRASSSMTLGMFIIGLVSSIIVSWVAAYAVTELYNKWEK